MAFEVSRGGSSTRAPETIRPGMSFGTLGPFFALAFGLTWGLAALLVLFPDQITALFGEVSYTNPLFILAVYSPAFAEIFLVWRHYGINGLGSYFRRLTLWRMPVAWWGFLVMGSPGSDGGLNNEALSHCNDLAVAGREYCRLLHACPTLVPALGGH